jgi:hypothetical protein
MKAKGVTIPPQKAEDLILQKDGSILRAGDLYKGDPNDDENVPFPE